MRPTHHNSWTGLPCNCPWGKRHGKLAKLAGQETNRILKAPDKAFRTPEGEAFKQILPEVVGEDHDSLAPYIANRFKKGDIQYHPGWQSSDGVLNTRPGLYYKNGSQANPLPVASHDQPTFVSGWNPIDTRALSTWNRWYQARQHPTRRGVNIMAPDFTPLEMNKKVSEHTHALEEERMLREELSQGDIVHKFPNGWHVRHLNSPGTDARESLEAEGRAMGHCIGDDSQPYMQNAVDGDVNVYSLRDKKGWPHGTWHTNPDGSIAEIHGNDNQKLSDAQHEMYLEWCDKEGKDPVPRGHEAPDPNAGDAEIEVPGAEDIDTYMDHHHPHSNADYYEDAHEYGTVGEDTNIYPGEPQWGYLAENLHDKDPKERQDFYNTIHSNGSHQFEPMREALAGDPEHEKLLKEFDKNHVLHYDTDGNYVYPSYHGDWGNNPIKGWRTAWDIVNTPLWRRPNERVKPRLFLPRYNPAIPEQDEEDDYRPEINAKVANRPQIVELGKDEIRDTMPEQMVDQTLLDSRRPFVYHPDDNQIVIGPFGAYHRQIDPNNHGIPGAALYSGFSHPNTVRSWGKIPNDILEHVSDHLRLPIHPEENQGWRFSANPETGEGYEWNFSEPSVRTVFPEGWEDSFAYNENSTRGRQRIPFCWTHHPEDINDVKLYMGHPGSYHDQLGEMHGIPFEELIGGYGSVKPRSYQTGNREDRDQHIEYYTVHDPRAMGSVADELTKHFDVKNQGFKNEPWRNGDQEDPDYSYEMQQGRFGAVSWPEPIFPFKTTRALGLTDGSWRQWDSGLAHAEYMIENKIKPEQVATYAVWYPADNHSNEAGWHDYDEYRQDYSDIYDRLEGDGWRFAADFQLPQPHPDYKRPNTEISKEDIEPWKKGNPGKFLVYPDGHVVSWSNHLNPYWHDDENPANKFDGWPAHDSVAEAIGRPIQGAGRETMGYIRPNGEIMGGSGPIPTDHAEAVMRQNPGTFYEQRNNVFDDRWKFANE